MDHSVLAQFGHALWVGMHTPAFKHTVMGAASGWVVAAKTDWAAFVGWKDPDEALAYNWRVALWRWFQGIVIGAVGTTGLGAWLG